MRTTEQNVDCSYTRLLRIEGAWNRFSTEKTQASFSDVSMRIGSKKTPEELGRQVPVL